MIALSEITEVAETLDKATNAEQVILFGSYARGDATENSDVDFLIIADSDSPRFKRSRNLYKLFRPYPFSMDMLVYTPEEVERSKQAELSFITTVLKEGQTLYESKIIN